MNDDPWANDKLNRRSDGEHLITVLLDQFGKRRSDGQGSYILNVDAAWGQGKTFFLDCLRADLTERGYLVASVNAWKDDHGDDPLITVMAAFDETLAPHLPAKSQGRAVFEKGKRALGIVAAETSKQMLFHAIRMTTGIAVEKTMERLQQTDVVNDHVGIDEKAFDKSAEKVWDKALVDLVSKRVVEHRAANQGIASFKTHIGEAVKFIESNGINAPIFVFVDELDRCRPLYAIKLLESLKHLFDLEGVVFVVATDSEQLSHSVRAIYGSEFAARKYLRRFFDRVFVFPDVERTTFIEHTFARHSISLSETFFTSFGVSPSKHFEQWADGLKLSNRDIVQVAEILATFVTSFEHKCKIEPNYVLGLSTAFYNADIAALEAMSSRDKTSPDFAGWRIAKSAYDQTTRRPKITYASAGETLANLATKVFSLDLPDLTDQSKNSLLQDLFRDEFQALHQSSYTMGNPPFSVLREYRSRVENAGRVVDK